MLKQPFVDIDPVWTEFGGAGAEIWGGPQYTNRSHDPAQAWSVSGKVRDKNGKEIEGRITTVIVVDGRGKPVGVQTFFKPFGRDGISSKTYKIGESDTVETYSSRMIRALARGQGWKKNVPDAVKEFSNLPQIPAGDNEIGVENKKEAGSANHLSQSPIKAFVNSGSASGELSRGPEESSDLPITENPFTPGNTETIDVAYNLEISTGSGVILKMKTLTFVDGIYQGATPAGDITVISAEECGV